ncbi:MAG: FtsX-like permease family protein, partial [Chloroflexota bacterium]|nr:FtsX-like permease family protein [Chloroflexota bacterium]
PAAVLSDAAGRFHRLRLAPVSPAGPRQTFAVTLDLPEAAFPVRLVTLALLPANTVRWEMRELSKPPVTVVLESLAADATVLEQWDGQNTWEAETDSNLNPDQAAAGRAELEASDAGRQPVTIILGRATRAVLLRSNPQELEPVPVGVNEPFLQANNLAVGDTALFLFRNRLVMVQVAAVLSRFPSVGIDAEPFVVAHGPRLLRLLNSSYARPVAPNEVWLDLPGDAATVEHLRQTPGIGALLLQTAVLRSFSRDPLAVGIAGVFFLGFVTSVGLTALGFAIATYLAGRRRTVEFAVLQAIGLDRRAVLGTLALEQAVLVVLALLAGTGLGAALGHLILPLMAVSDRGRAVVPPYVVIVPWRTLVVTYAALIALFAGVTMVVLRLLLRRGIGSALRIGEE